MVVAVGTELAGYRIEDEIARGGMGVVYRATEIALERPVAIKLIAPGLADDPAFRERFLREARLAASIDHPGILPVYAAGEAEGDLYLATRYVEGTDLRSLLEREGQLSPPRALDLVGQVADALDAAHARGLVHRDVKPGNVLVDPTGHCYLCDFGLTKQLAAGGPSATEPLAGSLDYLAPEQIRREQVDGRADQYALACVLYECLTGAPPFRRETEARTLWAHVQEEPTPLGAHPELDPVFARALSKDPSERYPTCVALVEEARSALGLGPSPAAVRQRQRRLGRRLLLVGAAMLTASSVGVIALHLTDGPSRGVALLAPGTVGAIDPRSNRILAQVPVAGSPARLAAERGLLWVGSDDSGTVSAVAPSSHAITKLATTGGFPSDLAFGDDAVWVLDGRRGYLIKVDASYGSVTDQIRIAPPTPFYDVGRYGLDPASLAVGSGSVWLTFGDRHLARVDSLTGKMTRIALHRRVNGVAVGAGTVWAISGSSSSVVRIDPKSGVETVRIPIASKPGFESPFPIAIGVGEGFVWILNGNTATVTKIDPVQRAISATIPIGIEHGPVRLAVGEGAAWVANSDGTLARIDAASDAVEILPLGHRLKDVAVAAGIVWVTAGSGFTPVAGSSGNAGASQIQALPTSWCSPIYYQGAGPPQYLIVSDLPLQGAGDSPQLSHAIRFVLRQHRFRAGPYAVGYQSCDDSTAFAGGYWPPRCKANARAYARNRSVVGVVGAYNSACTQAELPILNRAPGGPLAVISPSNTYVGLTRRGFATKPGEPNRYYPTGTRHYTRVVATDDVQGTVDALLAHRLGARRVFVLRADDTSYALGLASTFRHGVDRLGLDVVGFERWDAGGSSFQPLVARVAASGADVVFLAGTWAQDGPRLIEDLRAELGRTVQIMASDGFTPIPQVIAASGVAAEGMMVSVAGLPTERLPETGQSFVAAFGEAVGETPGPYSVYAAQATEVLLDAIARSDGSRASVTKELFRTRISDGILGSFSIDRNGDTTARAVTIYRIVRGRPTVYAVITPPAKLVR